MAGLFASLLGLNAATQTSGSPPPDSDFWYGPVAGGGGYGGRPAKAGRYVSPEISLQISTVFSCVNLLAKSVGSMPLYMSRVDRQGNKTAAPEHPLNDLLEYGPNSWQTAFDFKSMMMMHLALRGNAYAEIIPGPRGAVHSLEPLHPDTVQVTRLTDGSLRYEVSGPNATLRRLVQDEVFHIRSPICPGGIVGISPVAYAKEGFGLTLAAEEHGARMFSNGARPSGVIEMDGVLREPDFERFKSELKQGYAGLGNAHNTMVLEHGAKFKPITLRADELQMLETRQFQIEEIARWFDIPLIMLHSNTKTTSFGTGIESIMISFVRNTLRPWLKAWTEAISRDLIIAPKIYSAQFDDSVLQRGDSKAQADFFQKTVLTGVVTRNEARVALGYNPIEGLDEPLMPMNSMPVSAAEAQLELQQQQLSAPDQTSDPNATPN